MQASPSPFDDLSATEALPDARFSSGAPITMDALLAKARCLMPAAGVVSEVLPQFSANAQASVRLIRALESDPAAVALVMRIANAPGPRTGDLTTALSISGSKVCDALRAAYALSPPPIQAPYEERIRFWQVAVAVCARTIASYLDDTDRDAAYCAGMFSGMGRYAFAISLPAQYAEIVETASLSDRPVHVVERAWVEFDSFDLVTEIAKEFQLPVPLRDALGHRDAHSALRATSEKNLLPSVVYLSQALEAHLRTVARGGYEKGAKKRLAELANQLLGVTPDVLDGIIEESRWACFERGEILMTEAA